MSQLTEPVVSFLLQSISNLLNKEANLIGDVRNEAQLLESELMSMRALLKDAETKQDQAAAIVKNWIRQSIELTYEADDLLERFSFKIGSRRRGGIANELKRYTCFLNEVYIRHRVGVEIQSLKTRVLAINKTFQDNGMTTIILSEKEGSSSSKQRFIRRTYSHLEEDEREDFVGLESDVHILLEQLVNENHRVVSIYGMGGLGKTTIAKRVYNNASVIRHFNDRVWVYISQQWQTEDILRGILIKLMPKQRKTIQEWRCEELVRELSKVQHERKCLFVLDDMWKTDAWDAIKHAFSLKEKGGKIIITTRNKYVAEHVDPSGFHLQQRFLTDVESWELLRKKALKRRDVEQDSSMLQQSQDPLRLDGLSKLEILENYSASFCEPQELFKLANLRVFTIPEESYLDNNAFAMVADYVYHSNSLQYVSIQMLFVSEKCPVFVQKLLCARSMKELCIQGYHMRCWFPEYEEGLSTSEAGIVNLNINFFEIKGNPMETLNKLPNLHELDLVGVNREEMITRATDFPQLRYLHLYKFNSLQSWIVEKGAFPQLRTLILQNFHEMQSWIVEKEAMPNLSTLHLIGVESLSELPEGLKVLKTLKDLKYEDVTESLAMQIEAHLSVLP